MNLHSRMMSEQNNLSQSHGAEDSTDGMLNLDEKNLQNKKIRYFITQSF